MKSKLLWKKLIYSSLNLKRRHLLNTPMKTIHIWLSLKYTIYTSPI